MSERNRKPILIAVVCAAVAILVLGLGIGFGGRDSTGSRSWQEYLSGIRTAAALRPADLRLTAGSCSFTDHQFTVVGLCTFAVDKFGGSFDLGPPTKRATLLVIAGTAQLSMQIEGTSVSQNLQASQDAKLTFGKSGGTLTVFCAPLPCVLSLT
ncbi:hypothetical protein [Paenarthrobacter sp. PH39-S1]|uniref:hypothetical protein n=1 Tax=Paenarthrobacter sp. PH39-S1 TaxID=3046204 RepID=UPI0024BA7A7A|nr:hypothetical protein [Paenarthrobacter sp. PH39-S1]MDJ0356002.1 hypothetical protein [Paenarthrobacter sp. PH39-S1]